MLFKNNYTLIKNHFYEPIHYNYNGYPYYKTYLKVVSLNIIPLT